MSYGDVFDKMKAYEASLDAFLAAEGENILPALAEFCRHNNATIRLVAANPECYFLIRATMGRVNAKLDSARADQLRRLREKDLN